MQLIHRPDGATGFRRVEIPDTGLALRRQRAGRIGPVPIRDHRRRARDVAHVVPFVDDGVQQAALVVAPGVRDLTLGGRRPLDVHVLAERDEIAIGTTRFHFTARRPLVPTLWEGDDGCGVCGEATLGCVSIACTHCRAVTHAGALRDGSERNCFEHRGACPGCGLRAADFDWLPEDDDRA